MNKLKIIIVIILLFLICITIYKKFHQKHWRYVKTVPLYMHPEALAFENEKLLLFGESIPNEVLEQNFKETMLKSKGIILKNNLKSKEWKEVYISQGGSISCVSKNESDNRIYALETRYVVDKIGLKTIILISNDHGESWREYSYPRDF